MRDDVHRFTAISIYSSSIGKEKSPLSDSYQELLIYGTVTRDKDYSYTTMNPLKSRVNHYLYDISS